MGKIAVHTFTVANLEALEKKLKKLIPKVRQVVQLSHAHNNRTREYYDEIDHETSLVTNGSITVVMLYVPLSRYPLPR